MPLLGKEGIKNSPLYKGRYRGVLGLIILFIYSVIHKKSLKNRMK
jgi:hypothetical protein